MGGAGADPGTDARHMGGPGADPGGSAGRADGGDGLGPLRGAGTHRSQTLHPKPETLNARAKSNPRTACAVRLAANAFDCAAPLK
eukprot:1224633-Rhodomonas_salina.1